MDPLQQLLTDKKNRIRRLKAELKELNKGGKNRQKKIDIDREIADSEKHLGMFKKSIMEPRQIGSIVINYKLYEKFMKKLKGFAITEYIKDDCLFVDYQKGNHKGTLTLMDLTDHFAEDSTFKKGELYYVIAV